MRSGVLALLMAVAVVAPARAQAPVPAEPAEPQATTQAETNVDATKLGVSMSRIQKGLRISETRERSSGSPFKLEYQIQVFGLAPRFNVLEDFDIGKAAPLSYGAPTHADFIRQWTPQAYRSPRWPVGALAGWAFMQVAQKAEKSKCEQEIADYRALVMQGVSAPAPRCTQ
jgi:hypothetical protein